MFLPLTSPVRWKNAGENWNIVVYYVYFLLKSTFCICILVPACTRKMKQEKMAYSPVNRGMGLNLIINCLDS
jgi:hypothetical protein